MANAATLESLNIEINANSQKASEGVGVLITSLRSLAKAVGTVVPALREMNKGLKELSKYGAIKLPQLPKLGSSDSTKQIKEQTSAIQERINAINGIGRAAKSAKESAQWMDKLLTRQELKDRLTSRTSVASGTTGTAKAAKAVADAYVPRHAMKHPPITSSSWVSPSNSMYVPPNRPGFHDFFEYKGKDWRKENAEDTNYFDQRLTDIVNQDNALKNLKQNLRKTTGDISGLLGNVKRVFKEATSSIGRTSNAVASVGVSRGSSSGNISNVQSIMNGASQLDLLRAKYDALQKSMISSAQAGKLTNEKLVNGTLQLRRLENQMQKLIPKNEEASESTKEAGKAAEEASHKASGLMKTFQQIGRIAKTMLIRTALRSLMKAFSQSWSAAYEFSHAMGGSFAKSIDQTRTILADTTTSIIQTFAPVLQALVPVFYIVAEAVQYLCQGIQWLLSLLGLSSDLLGANTKKINKYYGDSSKAAKKSAKDTEKANKNLLASWDELNIIQSKNNGVTSGATGGGRGGSGYKPGSLKNIVSEEISAVMSIIVGEALLAIGLILACSGHLGIGLGLMAVGAASIAKTLVADWGKLPDKVKETIGKIMAIVAVSSLALGVVLLCTNHIGLGIGLIAIGLANMAAITAVTWGEEATSGVKKTVSEILGIGGALLLTLGIILLFIPGTTALGAGLLLAGGVSLASSIGLNWDTIKEKVMGIMTKVAAWFVLKWYNIQTAVSTAWDVFSKWADETLLQPIRDAWTGVSGFFATLFGSSTTDGSIAKFASDSWTAITGIWNATVDEPVKNAWNSVGDFFKTLLFGTEDTPGSIWWYSNKTYEGVSKWWDSNIARPVDTAWQGVSKFFTDLFADANTPGSIAHASNECWDYVCTWWTFSIEQPLNDTWKVFSDFFSGLWSDITAGASSAWTAVSDWWNASIAKPVESAWNSVSEFFSTLFGGTEVVGSIAGWANDAWTSVEMWWSSSIAKPVEDAWKSVSDFFSTLFGGTEEVGSIAGWANDAWCSVERWWTENIYDKISGAWSAVTEFFGSLWGDSETGIRGEFSALWADISKLWSNITKPIEQAWGAIATWFKKNVTDPISDAFKGALNWIIDRVNDVIGGLNALGSFKLPGFGVDLPFGAGHFQVWNDTDVKLWNIGTISKFADGAYGIPNGDLFVANEAGAELVGSMDGRTAVANQGQIIEGIQRGVRDANSEQNALLRQQNELLRSLLEKSGEIRVEPSAAWGKFNQKSNEMWGMVTGR